jgi:hypothetical protein
MSMKKIFFLVMLFSLMTGKSYAQNEHAGHMVSMEGMAGGHETGSYDHESMEMKGFYGSYPMTREASGTAWQPDLTPHHGYHWTADDWHLMAHGYVTGIYDYQQGSRGDEETLSTSMAMVMAQRETSGGGTFGLRGMWSLDPLMGEEGYPLLLQTGETANGIAPLIDRQHPHDFFMEMAVTYSHPVTDESSVFGYAGLPGEPALGPPTFMHRFSGMEIPDAPLSHHWFDSTHITFGVLTGGYVWRNWKIEGSAFRGREPDESRWDIEAPELDSYSTRVSYNPTPNWSFQTSFGAIDSPEQLHASTDVNRFTTSAAYHRKYEFGDWQTMLAWGQNDLNPGPKLDVILLESALTVRKKHTFLSRFEHLEKNELFSEDHPLEHEIFNVSKLSVGYIHDFHSTEKVTAGIGGMVGVNFLPNDLEEFYGQKRPLSYMGFIRLKI